MTLRDIIRGTKPTAAQSQPLAKLASLAIAKPTDDEAPNIPNNPTLETPHSELATANLANAANDNSIPTLTPFHFEYFNLLFDLLKKAHCWTESDHQAWLEDLNTNPILTIDCLEALLHSWLDGRLGAIEQKDWGRPVRIYKGLTVEQSKVAHLLLLRRDSWDKSRQLRNERTLCVECKHLIAFNGSWKCGNWQQAGLSNNLNGSGLSWYLITLFQRCDGFSDA